MRQGLKLAHELLKPGLSVLELGSLLQHVVLAFEHGLQLWIDSLSSACGSAIVDWILLDW